MDRLRLVYSVLAASVLLLSAVCAEEVHTAARDGDAARVEQLIGSTPGLITAVDQGGSTPLLAALADGRDNVAELLLLKTPCAYVDQALDARTAPGVRALRTGLLEKALPTLRNLLRKHPDEPAVNFAYGLVASSLRDYSRASLAFERILMGDDGNQRARVELAVAYLRQGHLDLAEAQFRQVLEADPPAHVREVVSDYIEGIRRRSRRWSASGRIDVGAFVDDNVNVGPASATVNIAPLTFGSQTLTSLEVGEASRPADDMGLFGALTLAGNYDIGRNGDWHFGADLLAYNNWLRDEHDEESRYVEVSAGLQRVGRGSVLQLPVSASFIGDGGSQLVGTYGVTPTLRCVPGKLGLWAFDTNVRAEFRDWTDIDERDSVYVDVTETVRRFLGTGGHSMSLALSLLHDHTDAAIYEYTGVAVTATGTAHLPWETVLHLRLRYRYADYDERETLAPEDRADSQWQVGASLNKMLTDRLGTAVSYQFTTQSSTFDLYEYDRNVTSLSAFYQF
jgi:hypothetical protein